mgnify:CR=1 FL=1
MVGEEELQNMQHKRVLLLLTPFSLPHLALIAVVDSAADGSHFSRLVFRQFQPICSFVVGIKELHMIHMQRPLHFQHSVWAWSAERCAE